MAYEKWNENYWAMTAKVTVPYLHSQVKGIVTLQAVDYLQYVELYLRNWLSFLFKKLPPSMENEFLLPYLQVSVTEPSLKVVDCSACCKILFVSGWYNTLPHRLRLNLPSDLHSGFWPKLFMGLLSPHIVTPFTFPPLIIFQCSSSC